MKKSIFQKTIAWLMALAVSLGCIGLSAFAADDGSVMTVAVDGGETRNFTSFNDGWVYAMEQSLESPTTLTLLADWVAADGDFYCKDNIYGNECGSNDGYLYINDNNVITIDLNGHKIDRNLDEAKSDGMVFYLNDADAKLTIKDSVGGGKITGGNNTGDGGAFYVYNGGLYIEGGEITGNHAANGGGIYWYSDNKLCITGGKITGNAAVGYGGAIYHQGDGEALDSALDNVYLGGDVQIYDNLSKGIEGNVYLQSRRGVNLAAGQSSDIPNAPFEEGATIGISPFYGTGTGTFSSSTSDFNYGDEKYFFSDSDEYSIGMNYNASSGRYRLYLTAKTEASDNVMSVTVEGAGEILFTDFGRGWAYAMEQSLSQPTIVKLLADWVAPNGNFRATKSNGSEYGTNNGRLYFNDNHVLVLNLNGHTIDRNLDEAKSDGMVFYLNDTDIRLTIRDDVGGGKITGGNNTGNGGAFYVYEGGLFIRGGEISGNHAENGGGIYWASENAFFMPSGRITGNTADENGGGIYHYGDGEMLTGAYDNMFFGGDVQIYGNSGAGDENNNLYVHGTKCINLTAGQRYTAEGYTYSIPNAPFKEGAVIGVTVSKGTGGFSARPNQFNLGDDKYFFSDSDEYTVRMDYDANYECYGLSLAANTTSSDAVMSVAVDGAEANTFTDFGQGWIYALEQSLTKPTTVKLLADWVAPNGEFYITRPSGWQYGTNNGYLYLNDNFNITIDLNGHKIDRNLSEAQDDGVVFYLNDYEAKLTIKDSVGGGKITGGNNTDEGGAFHMDRGSLYIESGEISGNKAATGAGIFAGSQNNLCVYGGKITGNIATENGGGIYGDDWGPFYFGGSAVISGNTANSAPNNLYIEDDDVVIRRTAGQQNGVIPNIPFEDGASIGISTYRKNNTLLSGSESGFGFDDYTYFFSDDSAYGIRPVYDSGSTDAAHKVKIYLDAKANVTAPMLTWVEMNPNAIDKVHSVEFDKDNQVVTVTAYYEYASELDSEYKAPSDVLNYTVDMECETVYDESFYWTNPNPIKMMLVTSDGTYGAFTVITKWVCEKCDDLTGDGKCDDCGKDVYLAAIGNTKYATLQAAVNAAQRGDTIKLLENNVLLSTVTFSIGKDVTIDFNGKKLITKKDTDYHAESEFEHGDCIIKNYANLTLTDSVGNESAKNMEHYGIKTYGTLTINGGSFAVAQGQNMIHAAINSPAHVVINAGTFDCASGGAVINIEGTSKLTVNGGTFSGSVSESSDINGTITGGTFSASEINFVRKYVAQGKLVAVNEDQTECEVVNNTYFTYLGAGLKYAGASADSAKIRFGYDFRDDFDLAASNWRWNFGVDKDSLNSTAGANYDEDNVTNLVVSSISPDRYTAPIYSQLVFDVVIDGETYTIEDTIRGTYINYLADAIIANPNESAAVKEYAEQLKAAYSQSAQQ